MEVPKQLSLAYKTNGNISLKLVISIMIERKTSIKRELKISMKNIRVLKLINGLID